MRVVQKVLDHGLPVDATLRDETVIRLRLASERDEEGLHILYNTIVGEGTSYPHDRPLTQEEFVDYWVRGKSTVVAYAEGSVRVEESRTGTTARCDHVEIRPTSGLPQCHF